MAKFTSKRETCIKCKTSLPPTYSTFARCDSSDSLQLMPNVFSLVEQATCEHCAKHADAIFQEEILKMNSFQEKFAKLWTQCQRCQGNIQEEVICTR